MNVFPSFVGEAEVGLHYDSDPLGVRPVRVFAAEVHYSGWPDFPRMLAGVFLDYYLARHHRRWRRPLDSVVSGTLIRLDEITAGDDPRWSLVPITDTPPPTAFARSTIHLAMRVKGDERRRRITGRVMVGEQWIADYHISHGVFASLWDWALATLSQQEIERMGRELRLQCGYYREHGMPNRRTVGKAPYHAVYRAALQRSE